MLVVGAGVVGGGEAFVVSGVVVAVVVWGTTSTGVSGEANNVVLGSDGGGQRERGIATYLCTVTLILDSEDAASSQSGKAEHPGQPCSHAESLPPSGCCANTKPKVHQRWSVVTDFFRALPPVRALRPMRPGAQ